MVFKQNNGATYLQFPNLARFSSLRHGVFTRQGGFSRGPFQGLNVGRGVGDAEDNVRRNRSLIAQSMGGLEPVFIRQVHGTDVQILSRDPLPETGDSEVSFPVYSPVGSPGCSPVYPNDGPPKANRSGDALVTDVPKQNIAIQTADCQAVLLYADDRGAIANVHAGWRGGITDILGKTVRIMVERFGCSPANIHAGIGPSLGPCCAEFIHYRREIPTRFWGYKDEKDHFDFWAISRDQLREAGVPAENIMNSGLCTRCRTDLFFSYRGEGTTGRFAAVIGLR